jgi:hypothetical protein
MKALVCNTALLRLLPVLLLDFAAMKIRFSMGRKCKGIRESLFGETGGGDR